MEGNQKLIHGGLMANSSTAFAWLVEKKVIVHRAVVIHYGMGGPKEVQWFRKEREKLSIVEVHEMCESN